MAVIGGGPAGLTAALQLAERGIDAIVFERDEQLGGLARTVERDGYRFDLGGHRLFTKRPEIELLWHELLGDDLLLRPRRSRIRWRGRYLEYPLRVGDLVRNVGAVELSRIGSSYLAARARPRREAVSFEQWVTDRFGRRLYEDFFRSYTEKVWGVAPTEISAEWAAQRIRRLSLAEAAKAALRGGDRGHHSLIEEFLYPRLGPGQLWEAMRERIEGSGGEVRTGAAVEALRPPTARRAAAVVADSESIEVSAVISSAPLRALPDLLEAAPSAVRTAALGLHHRDFITVALVLDGDSPFEDNWIYVHDPEVAVGRVQNFAAWSPAMVPTSGRACLGLEYFCFAGGELWRRGDRDLIELGRRELDRIGLVPADRVLGGHVVRVPKAYPIYDHRYAERIATIRAWLDEQPWLQQVGRNGMHRYNNIDHSMLTAMRAVDNLCGAGGHDLWSVNADSSYHEEGERPVVQPYRRPPTPEAEPFEPSEPRSLQEIA